MSVDSALVDRVRADLARAGPPEVGDPAEARERVRLVAARYARVADADLDALCAALLGYGPLQPLMDDATVTDILVNRADDVFVERRGRLERADVRFDAPERLTDLIFRIAAGVGRELTIERPYLDARLADGSRANAVLPPVGGPFLCIRKVRRAPLPLTGDPSWVSCGSLPADAAHLLARCVRAKANLLVAGATGSGKTTLLRALAESIPADERVIVVEDTSELVLDHPHAVRLECVPAREGHAGVRTADLVENALRMRPDRIVIGEIRTPREAFATLEALATGHPGSATTIHAADAEEALARLELLLLRADAAMTLDAARAHARRAFDLVVVVRRDARGRRAVRGIAAVGERVAPIFTWIGGELVRVSDDFLGRRGEDA